MEMKELYYFIAIAEEKSISKAAERLFMAQSSLSQFLGILENNVGSKLFIRTSRGVCLTQEGEQMLQYDLRHWQNIRSVQNEIKDIKQLKSGRVIMGISTFRGSYLLPPVLNAFHLEHPDVKVEIVEKNSMALEQMLLSGEIDIALLVMSEADPRLNIERVMKDEICLLTSPTHPIMAFVRDNEDNSDSRIPQYVNLKDTLAYEYLLSDYDTILGREARRIFNRNGVQPIASNHALSALMSAAMEQRDWTCIYLLQLQTLFQKCRIFIFRRRKCLCRLRYRHWPPGRYHSRAALALKDTLMEVLQAADG